jgi:hypothetical protein
MVSLVINSLRAFKGLYDLAFSGDQFYVEQRAEFLGGVRHSIEQAKEGYGNPPSPRAFVRTPFKLLLGIPMFVLFPTVPELPICLSAVLRAGQLGLHASAHHCGPDSLVSDFSQKQEDRIFSAARR